MSFFGNVQDSSTLFYCRESTFACSVNPLFLYDALDWMVAVMKVNSYYVIIQTSKLHEMSILWFSSNIWGRSLIFTPWLIYSWIQVGSSGVLSTVCDGNVNFEDKWKLRIEHMVRSITILIFTLGVVVPGRRHGTGEQVEWRPRWCLGTRDLIHVQDIVLILLSCTRHMQFLFWPFTR